jgi:transcriptional antiterminator RfaH
LKRRRHARRVEIVPAPLFPRYLFVQIDMGTQRWRSIFSTVGVSRLICAGETPLPVNQQILATLKKREDDTGLIRVESGPRFRVGDKVRILDGAFADCLGLYEGMPDCDRVSVLLDLLGRKVRIVMDAEVVTAA